MPSAQMVLVFMAAALALNLTPGPDMLYVTARSVSDGRAAGVLSAFGIAAGTLVHIAALALGLAALLAAGPPPAASLRSPGRRPPPPHRRRPTRDRRPGLPPPIRPCPT